MTSAKSLAIAAAVSLASLTFASEAIAGVSIYLGPYGYGCGGYAYAYPYYSYGYYPGYAYAYGPYWGGPRRGHWRRWH
jgi:hypothetical protein